MTDQEKELKIQEIVPYLKNCIWWIENDLKLPVEKRNVRIEGSCMTAIRHLFVIKNILNG